MRYINALIVITLILSLFVGCNNTQKEEERKRLEAERIEAERLRREAQVREYPSESWYWTEYFEAALAFMNNAQRRGFFKFETDDKDRKYQYLKRLGIDVLVDMKYLLSEAMDQEFIKPSDVKNIIFKKDTIWADEDLKLGNTSVLMGSRFNGLGYTHMYFNFVEGKLQDWGAYSNLVVEDEGEIKAECARINEDLAKIIRVGESMESIENKFTYFAEQNNELLDTYAKNDLEAPEMKNYLTSSTWKRETDNLVRSRIDAFMKPFYLLANKVENTDKPLGFDLVFKEPEVKIQRDITYWHYYMPFGARTIQYTITFRDRKVKSWRAVPVPKEY